MTMDMKNLTTPKSKNILQKDGRTKLKREKLTAVIRVGLTEAEKSKINKLAHKKGLNWSQVIRSLLKKHKYI